MAKPVQCPRCKRVDWAELAKGVRAAEGRQGIEARTEEDRGLAGGQRQGPKACPSCGSMGGHQKWCKVKGMHP